MTKPDRDELEKRRLLAEATKQGRVIKCAPGYPADWTPRWAEGLGPFNWGIWGQNFPADHPDRKDPPNPYNNSNNSARSGDGLPCSANPKKWPVSRKPS